MSNAQGSSSTSRKMGSKALCLAIALLSVTASASAEVEIPALPVWTTTGPAYTYVTDLEVAKDGKFAAVSGVRYGAGSRAWLTKLDAESGTEAWSFTSRYASQARAMGISSDSKRIAVGGWVAPTGGQRNSQMSIWMLGAGGRNLWSRRFTGDGANRGDSIADLVFSPDGRTVYVTGVTWFDGRRRDLVVIAYNALDGALRWRRVVDSGRAGRRGISEEGRGIAISDNGSVVVVTGYNSRPAAGGNEKSQALTLALRAKDGKTKWSKNSTVTNDPDKTPTGEAVAIHGSAAYVGGGSWYYLGQGSFAARHDLSDGRRRWSKLHTPAGSLRGSATAIAADARGSFLAGPAMTDRSVFHVWSQRASDGATKWETPADIEGRANDLVLEPGGALYAAGYLGGFGKQAITVVGIDPSDGDIIWTGQLDPLSDQRIGHANAVALAPDASRVFAAGQTSQGSGEVVIAAWDPHAKL